MTETPPLMTTPPVQTSGGIVSPITPDPIGTPDRGVMGYITKCFSPYVNFTGRARRKEFGLFMLAYMVIFFLLYILMLSTAAMSGGSDAAQAGGGIVALLLSLLIFLFWAATVVPMLGVYVRRAHDIGVPWWVGIIAFVFNWVGLLVLLFVPSQDGANIYGPYPKPRV